MEFIPSEAAEKHFVEFRRKVRSAELLSAAIEKLLIAIHFTGASGDNEQAEDEEAEEGNDLASVLLRRLSLPEPDESSESTAELEVANACAGNSVE
jgi:hypothetical protein